MCICVYATSGRHGDAFRRIPSCNWSTQVIVQIETAASATGVLRANESLKTRSRLIIAHLFDTCLRSRMRSVISSFGRQLGSNSVNKQYHGLYSSSQRLLNCCNTSRVIPAALTCRHCDTVVCVVRVQSRRIVLRRSQAADTPEAAASRGPASPSASSIGTIMSEDLGCLLLARVQSLYTGRE